MNQITIAKAWIEALNQRNSESLKQLSAPDIEIMGPRGSAFGQEALLDWFERVRLQLQTLSFELISGWVLAQQTAIWQLPEGPSQAQVVSALWVEDSKVKRYARFDNLAQALETLKISN